MPEIGKNDAAVTTVDTYVSTGNTEPPMAPSNSALKTGLVTMLWCYVIVISVCYIIILLGGAMSAARCDFFWRVRLLEPKKSCGQAVRRDSHPSCWTKDSGQQEDGVLGGHRKDGRRDKQVTATHSSGG